MIIACPSCNQSTEKLRTGFLKCRLCGYIFSEKEGIRREKYKARQAKYKAAPKPEKYRGKPAGKITYPGFVYGASRLW